jgi:ferredoxin-NADP reductase
MKATYRQREQLTSSISTFWFEPERPLSYTAGQFTELSLRLSADDERGHRRWFTLSSGPGGEQVSITTRYAGNDKSSAFKKRLFALEPGAEVNLADPMGDFVLPKLTQTQLVFVAGGIGLTPFHSIAEWLISTGEQRDIHLLYAVNNEDDIIWPEVFEQAGIHTTVIVGQPSDEWGGLRGRLDAEMILGLTKPSDDALIYMSGPEQMVEALEKDLTGQGIDKRQLVGDFFPGYSDI